MSSYPSFEKVGECLYRNVSSGTYFALVKHQGKQIRRSLETDQIQEARRKLRDFKRDVLRTDPSRSRTTLKSMVERYKVTLGVQSKSSLDMKERVCQRILDAWPGGADQTIPKIKPSDVKEFLVGYAGASNHNQARAVVRTIFQMAVDDGIVAASVAEKSQWRKSPKPIRNTPTQEEFRAIVQSIRSQVLSDTREEAADVVEFLGLAGLGQAEAKALEWKDVNLKSAQMVVFRQKTTTGFAVPIYPQLRGLMEKRYNASVKRSGTKSPPPEERVFSVADIKKSMAGAVSRLGLPKFTPRSLRRLFITDALEKGVDVKVIALWQGHQDGGKLILDTYSHVRPVHSERMAQLMR